MSRLLKGYLIALIGITFWSTTGILIAYLITKYALPALLLAFWRSLLVCVALVPLIFFLRRSLLRIERTHIGFYFFFGLILALLNSIWILSVETNGAGAATVLGYSSAGFTAILAWRLFNEKLGPPKILAVSLSLSGCVMVSNAYSSEMWKLNPLGVATGLLSGIFFASYNLLGKEAVRRKINPWTSLLYSFAFGSLFLLLFNLFPLLPGAGGTFRTLIPSLPFNGWLILIFLSFVPTLLGFGLYNTSLNYIPASIANLLATLETVMTAVAAYIFLGERMTGVQIMGGLVILSAVVIVQLEREGRNVPLLK
jgi:drug/metabolite transporter (DMT)-like permease